MDFINIHILQTIPFSNLNRDDLGSPKSMPFGGVERTRISSQALKRAQRVDFEAASDADMTFRSKFIADRAFDLASSAIAEAGAALDEKAAKALRKTIEDSVASLTTKSGSANTLIWIAENELKDVVRKAVTKHSSGSEADILSSLDGETSSLSIAAFGRFFAAQSGRSMEAAVQVAHAFTTHAQAADLDYFTAVDDLRKSFMDDGGAGHLDVAEFTSGTFYRYANIDRAQLAENWKDLDSEDAEERLKAMLRSMLMSLPRGKENSTAPHTPPAFVMIEVSRRPLSYAGAFERPVSAPAGKGFESDSVARLKEYAEKVRKVYLGEGGPVYLLDLHEGEGSLEGAVSFAAGMLLGR